MKKPSNRKVRIHLKKVLQGGNEVVVAGMNKQVVNKKVMAVRLCGRSLILIMQALRNSL